MIIEKSEQCKEGMRAVGIVHGGTRCHGRLHIVGDDIYLCIREWGPHYGLIYGYPYSPQIASKEWPLGYPEFGWEKIVTPDDKCVKDYPLHPLPSGVTR